MQVVVSHRNGRAIAGLIQRFRARLMVPLHVYVGWLVVVMMGVQEAYNTVYAKEQGSVAAPTAGKMLPTPPQ